ncbi:hypothetical protein [Streptomyces sp. NPDC047525]|uniref:hypothetical protein n=1 Tax=Streptomyces sp. NPDC047525 TaxID=3155264 RepID=UPI003400B53A
MPNVRTLAITSTVAAALALTSCSSGEDPVEHGRVIKKHAQAGRWVKEYKKVYRDRCTSTHTSAFTMSVPAYTGGSAGGRSTTSGGSGKGNTGRSSGGSRHNDKPRTSGGSNGSTTSGSSGSSTGSKPTEHCKKEYVGRKETGKRYEKGRWQLQLRDGDRTGWIDVAKDTYDDTDLRDQI